MSDIARYRESESEKARAADLMQMLPAGRISVLDVGARDGYFSRLLTQHFASVTALDLQAPSFRHAGVTTIAGDVTHLPFADSAFDCVFCAEVLEHVPNVERACHELGRVARHELVIGVPFRQDTRVGRTTCLNCGKTNPPWGHVNRFDERRLLRLFPAFRVISRSYVGVNDGATNAAAAALMDLAGNPWGTYDQEEPCIHCGARLRAPAASSLFSRTCAALAVRINMIQGLLTRPHGNWIHLLFGKDA
jgi:SAM-dependent methyltransferase